MSHCFRGLCQLPDICIWYEFVKLWEWVSLQDEKSSLSVVDFWWQFPQYYVHNLSCCSPLNAQPCFWVRVCYCIQYTMVRFVCILLHLWISVSVRLICQLKRRNPHDIAIYKYEKSTEKVFKLLTRPIEEYLELFSVSDRIFVMCYSEAGCLIAAMLSGLQSRDFSF